MVVEASRYIADGDIVMVGTGLPMVASLLALKNHAPNMCFIVETGTIAPEVIPTPVSVSDARVMYRAVSHGSLLDALGGVLQRGLADVGFIGGAQIDQFANVNSTLIGDVKKPKVRLPGSGGANDIASHAKKVVIIARHERRRFPEHCDYITSPGYIDGPEGRKRAGLPVPYPGRSRRNRSRRHVHRQTHRPAQGREADAGRVARPGPPEHRLRATGRRGAGPRRPPERA